MIEKCRHCGAAVWLAKVGQSHKWVSNPAKADVTWKCGNDPAFPVRAHDGSRPPIRRSRFTGFDPIRSDDIEEQFE